MVGYTLYAHIGCIAVYAHMSIPGQAWICTVRTTPVLRGVSLWCIQGIGHMGSRAYTPISHLPTSAQPRVGSYISPARMRPPVYTRTRIMRARGRAHAPARGDKPLNRSRNRWFVEDPSRTAHIQGMATSPVHRPISPMYRPVFAYVRPYTLYRPYTGYAG